MAKTIFEEMGGAYVRQGDYLLPCLSLPAEKEKQAHWSMGTAALEVYSSVQADTLHHSAHKR